MSEIDFGPLSRKGYFQQPMRAQLTFERAVKEKHRVDQCPSCGGPRVYSKIHPEARCFRCAERFELSHATTLKPSFRRCSLCRKQNMAGRSLTATLCVECLRLSSHERAKRRRWALDKTILDKSST
jgi:hypothetical protein